MSDAPHTPPQLPAYVIETVGHIQRAHMHCSAAIELLTKEDDLKPTVEYLTAARAQIDDAIKTFTQAVEEAINHE